MNNINNIFPGCKAAIFDLDGTLLESMHIWQKYPYDYEEIARAYESEVLPKPGVPEFLEALRAAKIRMVLATATDRRLILPALARTGLGEFFECIFTCGEVGASKESPLIYRKALGYLNESESLALTPAQVWVFEDAYYAINTAAAAGFPVAMVRDKWADKFADWAKKANRGNRAAYSGEDARRVCSLTVEDYTALLSGTLSPNPCRGSAPDPA